MMDIENAVRTAHFLANLIADASGVACICAIGPCSGGRGVRWEVVTSETGALVGGGVVAVVDASIAVEEAPAGEDTDEDADAALMPRMRGRRAAGRN